MQTVKINTNDNTMIFECDSVTIARTNQRMFTSAMEDAIKQGCDKPSVMIVTGGAIEDENGNFEDNREIFVNPSYYDDDIGIIGLVIIPNVDKYSIAYQFIYEGESVYIMNSSGSTIETLKAY